MSFPHDILETVPFLRTLGAHLDDSVLSTLRDRVVGPGTVIFRQSETSHSAYVVISGQVRITVLCASGSEMTIDVLGPMDTFGIAGLAGDLPRISNATASRSTRLLEIPTDTLRLLVARHPQVFHQMLGQLLRRLGRSIQEHVASGTQRVYARVAVKLLALSEERDGERSLPERFSHEELASMVGSTRATVTRVLQDLRRQGILDVEPSSRRLIIREAEKLSAMSDVESSFSDGTIVLP